MTHDDETVERVARAICEALDALDVLTWHYAELATYDGDITKESLTEHDGVYRRARTAAQRLRDAMGGE